MQLNPEPSTIIFQQPIDVLLVDNCPAFLTGVRQLLELQQNVDFQVRESITDPRKVPTTVIDKAPDIVCAGMRFDVSPNGVMLAESIADIAGENTAVALMCSRPSPMDFVRAQEAGVFGFIEKRATLNEIAQMVENLICGRQHVPAEFVDYEKAPDEVANLSEERLEWATAFIDGESPTEIAERMGTSRNSIYKHKSRMKNELGASSDAHLLEMLTTMLNHPLTQK